MKNVIVAFSDPGVRRVISAALERAGYSVPEQASSYGGMVEASYRAGPNAVLVTSLYDGGASVEPYLASVAPGCAVLGLLPPGFGEKAQGTGLLALELPVSHADFFRSVELLFDLMPQNLSGLIAQMPSIPSKSRTPEQIETDKAIVTCAKSLLMSRNHMSEAQAHRFIQKRSMNAGAKMSQLSLIILRGREKTCAQKNFTRCDPDNDARMNVG